MHLRRLALVAGVLGALVPSTARADDIESQVMSMINAARSSPLVVHAGLLEAARLHSQEMAARGALGHEGVQERVDGAAPDPPESDGSPDDGFDRYGWCENVTYVDYGTEGEAAGNIYAQWRRSAPHSACMRNEGKNVGAVGVYFDGATWWGTFIAEVDDTPPGASLNAAPAAPAATPSGSAGDMSATPEPAPQEHRPPDVAPADQDASGETTEPLHAEDSLGADAAAVPRPMLPLALLRGIDAPRERPSSPRRGARPLGGYAPEDLAGLVAASAFGGLMLRWRLKGARLSLSSSR